MESLAERKGLFPSVNNLFDAIFVKGAFDWTDNIFCHWN